MLEHDRDYVLIKVLMTGLQQDANSDQLCESLYMAVHHPDLKLH